MPHKNSECHLSHVAVLADNEGHKTRESRGAANAPPALSIGAGIPPVPWKLIHRIQAGKFVDMQSAVQHYHRLGLAASNEKSYQTGQNRYLTFCSDNKEASITHI